MWMIAALIVAQASPAESAAREIAVPAGQTAVIFLNPAGEVLQIVRVAGSGGGTSPTTVPAVTSPPAVKPPVVTLPPISVPNGRFGGAKAASDAVAARLSPADRRFIPGVRQNFLEAAAAIETGQIKDADAVNAFLKSKNRQLLAASPGNWIEFFTDLKTFTDTLHAEKRLKILPDYAALFREFGDGMEAAARAPAVVQSFPIGGIPACPPKTSVSPATRSSPRTSPADWRPRRVRLPATS